MPGAIEVRPAVETPWPAVRAVFGERGDPAGCFCQWFRLRGRRMEETPPGALEARLRAEVAGAEPGPGVVAVREGEAIGWGGVGPASGYPRRTRSPLLRGVEPAPWAITCFVVPPEHRRQGVARALLAGAVEHAGRAGAPAVDAIPVDTAVRRATPAELYHGPLALFVDGGFVEVARPSPSRAVVRLEL